MEVKRVAWADIMLKNSGIFFVPQLGQGAYNSVWSLFGTTLLTVK